MLYTHIKLHIYTHIYIHTHTHTYIYIYIYPLRVRGFAGTGITFSYPREKTRRVENQTRTRTRGYKLTPKPAPYRVFTRGHAGKMCPLPSLVVEDIWEVLRITAMCGSPSGMVGVGRFTCVGGDAHRRRGNPAYSRRDSSIKQDRELH